MWPRPALGFSTAVEKVTLPILECEMGGHGGEKVLVCLICVRVKWKIGRFCGSGDGRGRRGALMAGSDPNHREPLTLQWSECSVTPAVLEPVRWSGNPPCSKELLTCLTIKGILNECAVVTVRL